MCGVFRAPREYEGLRRQLGYSRRTTLEYSRVHCASSRDVGRSGEIWGDLGRDGEVCVHCTPSRALIGRRKNTHSASWASGPGADDSSSRSTADWTCKERIGLWEITHDNDMHM